MNFNALRSDGMSASLCAIKRVAEPKLVKYVGIATGEFGQNN
jgi:hypothetical protein